MSATPPTDPQPPARDAADSMPHSEIAFRLRGIAPVVPTGARTRVWARISQQLHAGWRRAEPAGARPHVGHEFKDSA